MSAHVTRSVTARVLRHSCPSTPSIGLVSVMGRQMLARTPCSVHLLHGHQINVVRVRRSAHVTACASVTYLGIKLLCVDHPACRVGCTCCPYSWLSFFIRLELMIARYCEILDFGCSLCLDGDHISKNHSPSFKCCGHTMPSGRDLRTALASLAMKMMSRKVLRTSSWSQRTQDFHLLLLLVT